MPWMLFVASRRTTTAWCSGNPRPVAPATCSWCNPARRWECVDRASALLGVVVRHGEEGAGLERERRAGLVGPTVRVRSRELPGPFRLVDVGGFRAFELRRRSRRLGRADDRRRCPPGCADGRRGPAGRCCRSCAGRRHRRRGSRGRSGGNRRRLSVCGCAEERGASACQRERDRCASDQRRHSTAAMVRRSLPLPAGTGSDR